MITTELYPSAHQDAQIINALADTLTNGNAFAAKICRKVARLITEGTGEHLNLRYAEIQGVAVSVPEAAQIINGLNLVKLGNDYDALVKAAQQSDELTAAGGNAISIMLEIGKALNEHPFTLAQITAQHIDDAELGELRANDTPGLRQEWQEHHDRRAQQRHPEQPRCGLQFVSK